MAIKDQFDTFDMRTTSGADAFWANDRPPNALVTCAIGEETGGSINKPSRWNNIVGLVPTRELVSADGMIQKGLNTRTGPMCRTVEDAARIFDAYAGYDAADELTAFSRGRMPKEPYYAIGSSGHGKSKKTPLAGYRIGVIREYMDKDLFPIYDHETIDIIDAAIEELAELGATIVDLGPHGALFQTCVDKHVPTWNNQQFMRSFPALFPFDSDGAPLGDHITTLVDMFFDLSLVPHTATGRLSIRNIGGSGSDTGGGRYNMNVYIRERGDAEIQSLTDLYEKANFFDSQPNVGNGRGGLESSDQALTLTTAFGQQDRHTVHTVVYDCFASMDLDAVVYPSSNIAPGIATSPELPGANDRGTNWTTISVHGFPALTVPAGFTTQIYDRSPVDNSIAPVPAKMPVGLDILALPFEEPTVFAIGAAYEAATRHRTPPEAFGPLESEKAPKPWHPWWRRR